MTTTKKGGGRRKLLALVVFRNQTVGRTTANLRTYETLPRLTQRNVDALNLDRRFAKRRDLPDDLVDQTFRGKTAEAQARAAAEAAGFELITYQEITFRRARQVELSTAPKRGR